MKPTLFRVALIALSSLTLAQAQDPIKINWSDLASNKQFKFSRQTKNNLDVSGIPDTVTLRAYLRGNTAFKIKPKQTHGNLATFELDQLINAESPINKVILFNNKTRKDIDSLILTSGTTHQPTASNLASSNSDDQGVLLASDPAPIAFYDAQILYDSFAASKKFPTEILSKYPFNLDGNDPMEVVKNNPFFAAFLKINETKAFIAAPGLTGANSAPGAFLANLAGIDVTKYVQAAADFLRDRIKEELTIAFIEKLKAKLDSVPELKALLPKTYNVFNTSDPFKIPTMGQTYKTAFQEDLEEFVANFEMFIDTTTLHRYAALKTNQVFTAFRIAYHAIDMSANNFHPIDIFEFVDARFGYDDGANRVKDINKYASLLNMLSQNLRKKTIDESDTQGWVDINTFKKFNPHAILLFWGLVYQQKPAVFDNIVINSKKLTDLILSALNTVQVYIKQFVLLANNIDQRIKDFKTALASAGADAQAAKNLAVADFIANADNITDITDFIFKLPYFKDEDESAFFQSDYYTKWRPIIMDVIETTRGIAIKNYAKIAVNATSLVVDLSKIHNDTVFTAGFLKQFTFYTNFIIDAINADSADDVKAVLNRYAEPVGSYRIKRKVPFSISVNAYPGLYFGWETYKNADNNNTTNRTFGVTAPIGFSFNVGDWPATNWSTSLYLSAVDIGAALSFRWSNDTVDLPEKITLGQIFSPGAFIVVGFPKVPIAARVGAQYAPQLRSITKDGNTLDKISAWRYGLSIVVDIPVFNFYNRSR